jgi:hypothetical protein
MYSILTTNPRACARPACSNVTGAKCRLQGEALSLLDVALDETLELPIRSRSDFKRDVVVGATIQFGGAISGIEKVHAEVSDFEDLGFAGAGRPCNDIHARRGQLPSKVALGARLHVLRQVGEQQVAVLVD